MTQTRTMSAIESVANITVGSVVALITQVEVFPLFGIYIPISDNIAIMVIFTVVSFMRSFFLRRAFNLINEKE